MQFSMHLRAGFAVAAASLTFLPVAEARSDGAAQNAGSGEASLVAAVNDVRAAHGLQAVRVDPALVAVARAYSATMIRRDVFTHGAFAARLARSGARGPAFGENLAWGTGPLTGTSAVMRGWLASPGHRANLLRPGWNRVGIGTKVGTFLGRAGATVVTADFAGS